MTERKPAKRSAGDYPVGYGKPPVATQFKKGQPRPPRKAKPDKPAPSFEDYLEAELAEQMRIVENGVEQYVPKGKALAKASIKGALDDRDPRRLKGFLRPARAQEDFDFSEVDLAIVARFMAQLVKQSRKPGPDEEADEAEDDTYDDTDGEARA
ncbi:hypothetical protein H7F51_18280 [Novosphingobium flavum]|uniref:DUF5681 domain-containing protein n=1 Tax=Novosphingobium flavum TaxID=1778672 RepID=A0A7X1KNL3_9SPHN|nr:hypothetical protein [Novosphingobium flavum]MBC2667470.1 hypothetical protein [Novosphingobium flavum]